MKIGIAQIDCDLGNVEGNMRKFADWCGSAKEKGCEVVVFPEMIDTGYSMNVISESASDWNGEPLRIVRETAEKNELSVLTGISEREGDDVFNTLAVVGPDGNLIGKYRKSHLASYSAIEENKTVTSGNSGELIDIGNFKFGLLICYDLRFPEMARSLVLKGADVLILSSAWPFPRIFHWDILTRARAIENQVYFVAANRTGTDVDLHFCGSSRIIDPYGIYVSRAAEDEEELIIGDLSKGLIESVRSRMPVLEHRRPDVYGMGF